LPAVVVQLLRRLIILLLGFFDGVVPAVSSARRHGGQFLSSLLSGGGSFPRWWDLLFAPWGLVFLVGFRFAGGRCLFRSVCLGDSMAGRRGFGAALLLSLDGGGASFSFLWCSTGWWPMFFHRFRCVLGEPGRWILRHLPTSGAPCWSCSGGLSGARHLLRRRRPEFTVASVRTFASNLIFSRVLCVSYGPCRMCFAVCVVFSSFFRGLFVKGTG